MSADSILRSITIEDNDGNTVTLTAEMIREVMKAAIRNIVPIEIPVDVKRVNVLTEDGQWVTVEIDISLGLYVMGKESVPNPTEVPS